ncbi:hypothetical protein NDU88_004562 [Pleurodeles waltl]|uniref:Uncharacterized protein n=1 Tax=Pleurodeles waltl TaxID=8319 RepID=A0AAV7NML5_PLEWA|nr:hypothetical protein NDU88_004562 [Pleurodeles waltl]
MPHAAARYSTQQPALDARSSSYRLLPRHCKRHSPEAALAPPAPLAHGCGAAASQMAFSPGSCYRSGSLLPDPPMEPPALARVP